MDDPLRPPVISAQHDTISYDLKRLDVYYSGLTLIFRNRILAAFVLILLLISTAFAALADGFSHKSVPFLIFYCVFWGVVNLSFLAIVQSILVALMVLSKKDPGLFCRHALQITNEGLVETTDVNRGLHKWAAFEKIISANRYVYIYTGPNRFFQVPRRALASAQLEAFEREMRRRVKAAKT